MKRYSINTPEGKKWFINELCNSLRDQALIKVIDMPNEWDGHELRRYLSDRFAFERTKMSRSRVREYNNTILVNNL